MYQTVRKLTLGLNIATLMLATSVRADDEQRDRSNQPANVNAQNNSDLQLSQAQKDLRSGKFSVRQLSRLYGQDLYNSSGKDIGDVKNVTIAPQAGQVVFGIVNFSHSVGVGDKYFAIPWTAIATKVDDKDFKKITYVMDADKNKLEQAKGFNNDSWPNLADRSFSRDVFSYWGQRPYWESPSVFSGRGASITGTPISPDSGHRTAAIQDHLLIKGTDLVSHELLDQGGTKIGTIYDVMADLATGTLVYLLTKANDVKGMGDKYRTVPFSLVTVREKGAQPGNETIHESGVNAADNMNANRQGKLLYDASQFQVILETSTDKLKGGPSFDEGHWPDMSPQWGEEIYNYYGVRPFWKAGMNGAPVGQK